MDNELAIKREPPHNQQAEEAVIGSMLMDREAIIDVGDILVKDDFYNNRLGVVFENIIELNNNRIDVDFVTLLDKLRTNGVPESVCDANYLRELAMNVPTSANAKQYANIVKDKAVLRTLIQITDKVSNDSYGGKQEVGQLLDDAERAVFELAQKRGGSKEFASIDEVVIDVLENIEESTKNRGKINGVPTGFIDLDNMLTGLHGSELILIAARPAMGKTAFVLNIARHAITKANVPVAMFSLEMNKEQLVTRLMAMDAKVDSQGIRTGNIADDDWSNLIDSAYMLGQTKLFIDDTGGITIADLRGKCRRLKQLYNIGLVIIDYLQLMDSGRQVESRQNEIAQISRALKGMARELNIPVIALSQLSRAVDARTDHKPVLSDLRESGAIEQDADVVMFIYREDYYLGDEVAEDRKDIADIIIAKQRNGSTGTVSLKWTGKYTRFDNLAFTKN